LLTAFHHHYPPLFALTLIPGLAAAALIAFLVELFDVPKSAVKLTSGELSRSKVFLLRGITLQDAEAVLHSMQSLKG